MMSLSKELQIDPLKQVGEGYHADYIGSKSINDLPTEILMTILSYVSTFPLRFNLCCVNHQWNNFIHKYFKNIGIVNVQKYAKMDKFRFSEQRGSVGRRRRNIKGQMKNIVGFWKHSLEGLEFNGTVNDFISGMNQLSAVIKMCAGQDTFQVIRFELESGLIGISPRDEQLIFNFVSTIHSGFPGLKELKWHCDLHRGYTKPVDLSEWTNLRSLDYDACVITQLPPSITSLKLKLHIVRDPRSQVTLINFLTMISEQLESVELYFSWNTYGFEHIYDVIVQLPRLRHLIIAMGSWTSRISHRSCSFDLSRSTQIESLRIHLQNNCLGVTGLDFSKHRNLSTFCITSGRDCTKYDLMPCFFTDAELNKLKLFTLNCSSNIAVDILRRLSLGCAEIRDIDLRIDEVITEEEYSSLVPKIMRNCPYLEKLCLSNFGIADRDIVDLIVDTYSLDKFVVIEKLTPHCILSKMMSLSKELQIDPLKQVGEGYHADYIGSKSINDLPTEILMNILSYVSTFPLRFNLCCVNHQWNNFIHTYFKNIGIVNVQKYAKMDKFRFSEQRGSVGRRRRNIKEQMKNIVGFWKHSLEGLAFNGTVNDFISGMNQLSAVIKMCAGQDTFQVIRFELESGLIGISPRDEQLIFNFVSTIHSGFPGLKELKWHCDLHRGYTKPVDLSEWTNLRSLDYDACVITQLPPSITSLKLKLHIVRDPRSQLTLINFLTMISEQLESVELYFS